MAEGGGISKDLGVSPEILNSNFPYVCSLSNDLLLRAQKELHEKPEWRQRDIEGLRQMILQQYGLHSCLSDHFLLRFLRSRKFDYDRSLQTLVNYYLVRYNHPEIFKDLVPSADDKSLLNGFVQFLPGVDYHGRRVLCIDLANWKGDTASIDELLRFLFFALELELCLEASQVSGIAVVMDLRGLSLSVVLQQLKPSVLKKISNCLQGSFPLRLKSVHLVHESTILDVLITMIKPFLTEKLRQRLYFHGNNLTSLQQHMDRDVLPESLGGDGRSMSSQIMASADSDSKQVQDEQRASPRAHMSMNELGMSTAERILAGKEYFEELRKFGFTETPSVTEECEANGALRSVLTTYKKICIDGLNA